MGRHRQHWKKLREKEERGRCRASNPEHNPPDCGCNPICSKCGDEIPKGKYYYKDEDDKVLCPACNSSMDTEVKQK